MYSSWSVTWCVLLLQHECQHHHSKTKKHSKKSKKHHRKRSRSRSVSSQMLHCLSVLCLEKKVKLSVNNSAIKNLRKHPPSCQLIFVESFHFNVFSGLRVWGWGIPQEEKEVAVQISFWTLLQWRIWWVTGSDSAYHQMEEVQFCWHLLTFSAWNQREAIRNPRSTRRRERRDATSL